MLRTSPVSAFAASALALGLGGVASASATIDPSTAATSVVPTEWLAERPHLPSPVLVHSDTRADSGSAPPQLLSTDQLAGWIESGREMTILDVRSDLDAYFADHVDGAVFLHTETLRATRHGVPAHLLSARSYADLFGTLGVRRDQPVVVYSAGDRQNFFATFVAWLLHGMGHQNVFVLDGGYGKWTAESQATSRRYPKTEAAEFTAKAFTPAVASLDDVRRASENPNAILVDARPVDQYTGRAGPQLRRGHIPGAIDHPWSDDLMNTERGVIWRPIDELRISYEQQGITPDKEVIVYCNTGTEASHLYFALRALLGYPNVRVYVPSWTEWSEREDLPIQTETS